MMENFFRVAALIFMGAGAVYVYEMSGGELAPAAKKAAQDITAKAISRSPAPRQKSDRAIDRSGPMPSRPAPLDRMVEARGGSDFPILIPEYLMRDDAAAKHYNVRLRLSDDGYTSVLTLPDYDVVIYGTRKAFRKPSVLQAEAARKKAAVANESDTGEPGPLVRPDYDMSYEDGDDGRGGSLSFGRYGVDYHIEFYCHGDIENCVDASKAKGFLADIFRKEEKKADKPRFRIEIGISGSTQEPDRGTGQGGRGE